MLYVTAKRIYDVIKNSLESEGFPFIVDESIIPNKDDNSTLFVCSGMQRFKNKFLNPDGSKVSSIQTCIRTNDIELVGDGTHLSSFKMIGNFSFKSVDYNYSVYLWDNIIKKLKIPVTSIHIHPKSNHKNIWEKLQYNIIYDNECLWSDGNIGGYCSEVYCNNLEIGNLVNTLEHSTDVGFGLERIIQVVESKERVDETCLFDLSKEPIVRDYIRTLNCFWDNKIEPGNKGRNYICRKLIRRILNYKIENVKFQEWIDMEIKMRNKRLSIGRKMSKKYLLMSDQWWWDTFGISSEERKML